MADACDVRQRARVGPSQVAEPQEAGCLYGVPQTQVRHRYSVVPHLVRAVLTDGGEQRLVLGAPAERAGELGPLVVLVWGEIPVDRVLFDRIRQQVLRARPQQSRPQQHAGQRARGIGAAAEAENADRITGTPMLHQIPVSLRHIVFQADTECLLEQQDQGARQRSMRRRQGSHTGVVVGDLAGRIVLLQHLEELGDVGEIPARRPGSRCRQSTGQSAWPAVPRSFARLYVAAPMLSAPSTTDAELAGVYPVSRTCSPACAARPSGGTLCSGGSASRT